MTNDYISIIGSPKVVGEINAIGKWNATDDVLDPYTDIVTAASKFPLGEIPAYLLVNNVTNGYLYMMDSERIPFIETIFRLFGYSMPGNSCCDLVTTTIKEIIITSILRINNELSNDVILLVSNKNSIVAIHV